MAETCHKEIIVHVHIFYIGQLEINIITSNFRCTFSGGSPFSPLSFVSSSSAFAIPMLCMANRTEYLDVLDVDVTCSRSNVLYVHNCENDAHLVFYERRNLEKMMLRCCPWMHCKKKKKGSSLMAAGLMYTSYLDIANRWEHIFIGFNIFAVLLYKPSQLEICYSLTYWERISYKRLTDFTD